MWKSLFLLGCLGAGRKMHHLTLSPLVTFLFQVSIPCGFPRPTLLSNSHFSPLSTMKSDAVHFLHSTEWLFAYILEELNYSA